MIPNLYSKILQKIHERNLYPTVRTIDGSSSDTVVSIEGKECINFSSANYLGLARDPRIISAVNEGFAKYGLHPTGARLISGTLDIHSKLEREISEYQHAPGSMVLTTGTMANMGTIPALMNLPLLSLVSILEGTIKKEPVIFSDQFNHATIVDGCRLAKAKTEVFPHKDYETLEKKLKKYKGRNKLIISDGVFSMDGDVADLPTLSRLAKQYESMLMIDDAHAIGVFGENGCGTWEHYKMNSNEVDIKMGTFSKAFGLLGAFIASEKDMIDYLRVTSRTYIFTGAYWGGLANGVLTAMEIVKNEKFRRDRLWSTANRFRESCIKMGFHTFNSASPIVPILIGDENTAINFSEDLFKNGFLVPPSRWPATEKGKARIRFSINFNHTDEQIDKVLNIIDNLKLKYKIA